jgi:DNA-directed RNA polymerase sigma subunit (sigma70/sigma32)
MEIAIQAENINSLLNEIYKSQTRFSNLLLNLGYSTEQISTIRTKHLSQLYTDFSLLIENLLTTKSTGNKRLSYLIIRRYGLSGGNKETLVSIGTTMGISRERVRQLQVKALRRLQSKRNINLLEEGIKKIINNLLNI